ncbi:thiol reductant ABC exporter subunit CydD [Salipaludibacillus agaradhaerens]|uniref:thiol reductant ABC exporter subunit CydD n=1 Tax=Salipaludibacillus agaradhaerens TaxID=76935 RepID=UPI00215159B0|nr:thiol reductant ABC exporter subunit CydD [Salipaludibacillus agaradhaerens]MCR6105521.1 thiol reductant ABC exporter subunit CydD [Salipaludibacillus agaradhaerens]MCR6117559.1 thiol reductant ABC exporter subunit CydD [Salipaludibacillus agaradhaerens]UJW56745.1 thiol reductant ABC exporter subunit CydD [Bacillus sp. A116_S68]
MADLKKMAKSKRRHTLVLMVGSLIIGASIIAQAYLIVAIVDHIFLNNGSFQDVIPQFGLLALALIMRALFSYVNGRTGIHMAASVKKQLRQMLLKKYSRNPLQASLKGQSGEKVSVLMDSVDEVDSYFSHYYPIRIQATIIPLMMLIAIFSYNWVSGLILLITAPFIPITMAIVGKNTQQKSEEQMEKLSIFSGRFLDLLQGLATLKFFGRAKEKKEDLRQSSLDYREATMKVLKIAFLSSLMLEFISMLSTALVALEVGLRLVVYQQLSFFTAFFVLILVPEFFASLKELGSAFHTGRGSVAAAKRVQEELEEDELPVDWGNETFKNPSIPPTIELQNLSFSYGGERTALDNVSTVIPPMSHVAIIGPSGAGKSTLLNILSGLIRPESGNVLLDHKSMATYSEEAWFTQISYISQNPYIFSGTIKDNIILGVSENVSDLEVRMAAEKAGISHMIERLEKGYDTAVGEGGRGLSGGEKQRVALARAFLKKPTIILFDEPTVGLDLKTEQILQQSMKELGQKATVITVAHRLHTIKEADSILLLSHGQVKVSGTHEQLLRESVDYQNMVMTQQGGRAE